MNILLFVIGSSPILHQQAHYALRTIYLNAQENDSIYILTDAPALYKEIPFVETIVITEEEIKDWYKDGYFFRIKINAIRKFVQTHTDSHLLFMDCDTYCFHKLSLISTMLNKGYGVLHRDEGSMELMRGDSGKMWQQTKNKTYAGITITNIYHMWNSGVVGIPRKQVIKVMDKALELCDAFLNDHITCFNLEQWSVSIALQQYTPKLLEADHIIGHYWHHKNVWTKYIFSFFLESYALGRTLKEELHIIGKTNLPKLATWLAFQRVLMKVFCKIH